MILLKLLRREVLFCDINPTCYAISEKKEIIKRDIKDFLGSQKFAKVKTKRKLPNVVTTHSSKVIKVGKGIDPVLQENKAVNIKIACEAINGMLIRPGETFSFWRTVGKITRKKGYLEGRVISGGALEPGLGGGLCNLGNTIHLLAIYSPLKVTEFHSHSDALAPDGAKRIPMSSGTSVCYNYIDLRFKNTTDQLLQLCLYVKDGMLVGELRSEREFPRTYGISEEGHHFRREGDKFYRVSKIYKDTYDRQSGKLLGRKLILDNHSEVMFDYDLIPKEQIKEE